MEEVEIISEEIEGQSEEADEEEGLCSESSIPLLKEDGLHSYLDALVIIQNAKFTDRQVTLQPPCKPLAGGQVYVYGLQDGHSPYDWRFDGFQWQNLRANSFPKGKSNPTITRHEFRLLDDGRKVDFYRHEYHEAGHKFKLPVNLDEWKYPFIVIHYFGNYPVNEATPAPHGNRKNRNTIGGRRRIDGTDQKGSGLARRKAKPRKVVDTSDLLALASAVDSITGNYDYSNSHDDGIDDSDIYVIGDDGETLTKAKSPKRRKVIKGENMDEMGGSGGIHVNGPNYRKRSAKVSVTKNLKVTDVHSNAPTPILTKDDLYGCYLFQESIGHDRVLRTLDFSNGADIIISEDNLLKHVNCVLNSGVLNHSVRFHYSHTAKLYRFSISTLFIRHPIFENEPNIPVAILLHRTHNSESHTRFFKIMKGLIPTLNSSYIELTVNTENGVFPSAKEELNENPRIKSSDANSPRVSSPKLDFVLTSVAKNPNFDHIKMIHLVYFLQCYFLNDIKRSLLGNCEGDLLIKSAYDSITCDSPSLADRLLPSGLGEVEDAMSPPELIAMLGRNPPVVLGSGSDYDGCSRAELALFEGLAHFFISKDRILWVKDRRLFSVRGLGGVDYQVKLSGRTCTCLRGKACEHVLAVLIATGLLASGQVRPDSN